MDRAEREKIFRLLAQFYPNARQIKDPVTRTAWGCILSDFTYEDVKAAVLKYVRRNKFFPDVADITAELEEAKPAAEPDAAPLPPVPDDFTLCRIIHSHPGMVGLELRAYCPDECAVCRKYERPGDCPDYRKITEEQRHCRILQDHGMEGPRGDILRRHGETYCPSCHRPCVWPALMREEARQRQ